MRIGGWRAAGLTCILVLGFWAEASARNTSVVYQRRKVLGLPVNVVKVDLNDPNIKVTGAVARGGLGRSERFKTLINRAHPAAAITGTFFDTRSLLPVGDIVVAGERLHQGAIGTGVAFDYDNRVHFVPLKGGGQEDWLYYEAVICAGPWLVKNGIRTVRPWAEGYRDRSLYRLRPRAAIGFTRQNKMLLVTVPKPVHYTHVSKVMKALGAVNALGLDGGSSTALSIRGRIISKPGRRLTNVLLVYDRPAVYERAVAYGRLAPQRPANRRRRALSSPPDNQGASAPGAAAARTG